MLERERLINLLVKQLDNDRSMIFEKFKKACKIKNAKDITRIGTAYIELDQLICALKKYNWLTSEGRFEENYGR